MLFMKHVLNVKLRKYNILLVRKPADFPFFTFYYSADDEH